jgi:hypothetical protein
MKVIICSNNYQQMYIIKRMQFETYILCSYNFIHKCMLHVSWLFSTVPWATIYSSCASVPRTRPHRNCSLGGPWVGLIDNLVSTSRKFLNNIHLADYTVS